MVNCRGISRFQIPYHVVTKIDPTMHLTNPIMLFYMIHNVNDEMIALHTFGIKIAPIFFSFVGHTLTLLYKLEHNSYFLSEGILHIRYLKASLRHCHTNRPMTPTVTLLDQ